MNIDEIKQRLNAYFTSDKVEVFDSRGTGDHFSVIVISGKFINVSLVDRHRMIYSIFEDKVHVKNRLLGVESFSDKDLREVSQGPKGRWN